ncbi:EthD family reductase [Mycobacterium sp. 21AC1]|uniref:EthD family reductase n=1 Tax=[Mycobacterium] appelbergii TaxID=2939269 RepID=UPI002938DC44|nr:EthD family reductase [Mycobacterium sp. 21AC1]MDV3128411.1 EthD family reductase [Mycobacterium sp. 21AC1]
MTTLMVNYVGDSDSRFDRDRYLAHHIPLVVKTWQPFGLKRVEVFFTDQTAPDQTVAATCLCHFIDRPALERALAAPETAPIMADITTFTDITPSRFAMRPALTA